VARGYPDRARAQSELRLFTCLCRRSARRSAPSAYDGHLVRVGRLDVQFTTRCRDDGFEVWVRHALVYIAGFVPDNGESVTHRLLKQARLSCRMHLGSAEVADCFSLRLRRGSRLVGLYRARTGRGTA
jgi:hypothetical protein